MSCAQNDLAAGMDYQGFRLNRVTELPGLRTLAYEFEHIRSGAHLLHLHNDDIENCFAVTFPTPPPDETGLPHILEHSVLAGSRKYPVREPFFELVKMSMATFINAMTSQSFTVYPVATTVRQDFFNLVDVYLDAIFHPQITHETFQREGHHLSLADNNDLSSPLTISGIVYSEMKGYWSMPDVLLSNIGIRGLFPDTPLGHDSGGDPEQIPELTYEQFKRFYDQYYHPSNALIFTYGDIPTADHLATLAPVLNAFERRQIDIPTPRQPRWAEPRQTEAVYPVDAGDGTDAQTYIVMSWIVDEATDPARTMEWSVLATLLLGDDASPLKKAIIDSKLGADLHPSGDMEHAYEIVFEIGLRGSEPNRREAFETLVLETLAHIAAHEIPESRIESAFHQVAYHHLEVDTLFPLKLLQLCDEAWPYGKDPLTFLRMERDVEECQARYLSDRWLFNRMITEKLIANPHRITVVLKPDPEEQGRSDAALRRKMADQRAQLTEDEIAHIAQNAAALSAAQMEPNSPKELATLPQLGVGDLPKTPRHIPTTVTDVDGITVLHNDVFSNGVNYIDLDIDLSGLPADLYAWLPRYSQSITKMGAAGQDYTEIAERRSACTGGMHCGLSLLRHATDPSRSLRSLRFGLKVIDDKANDALQLLHDLIFEINPRDTERLHSLLVQSQSAYRSDLVADAMHTALRHAGRGLSLEAGMSYQFNSREALHGIDRLLAEFDTQAEMIIRHIETIRDFLRDPRRWTLSFTGSDHIFDTLNHSLRTWAPALTNRPVADVLPPFSPVAPPREGLAAPIKVAHCTQVMPAPEYANPDTPLYELGLYLTQFDYLLPEIRLRGNAYGAGAQYNGQKGTLAFYSYNDPRITETLAIFKGVRDFVHRAEWTQTDVDRAIIGFAKKIVQAIRPGQATADALTRHVAGISDELREQRYAITRTATPAKIKQVLQDQLAHAEPAAGICVAAGRDQLEQANQALGTDALDISAILGYRT